MEIDIRVNEHFVDYLNDWNKRFYLIAGGYGSSKSYNTALKLILKSLQEKRKILIIRNVADTLRDSCFSLFREIVELHGLSHLFAFATSRLSIKVFNGSEFVFKGMDKPEKLKSINDISIAWVEECSEVSYDAFEELNGRLRVKNKSLHIFLTFNPVSKSNWTYKRFFTRCGVDEERLYRERVFTTEDTYYHHSVAEDNKFLPQEYIEQLKKFENYNSDLYRIAYEGRFGTTGERVFTNVEQRKDIEVQEVVGYLTRAGLGNTYDGLDYGFSVSYNALVRMAVDRVNNVLYVYDEIYNRKLITTELIASMEHVKTRHRRIIADNARPETTEEIRRNGFRIENCKKGAGSVIDGLQKLQSFYKIVVSDKCKETFRELIELCHVKNRQGEYLEGEFTIDPHTVDAMRYGLEEYRATSYKSGAIKFTSEV